MTKSQHPPAVFFDLDGTFLDTADDLSAALNALLLARNMTTIAPATLRTQVSNGANALIQFGFDITPEHSNFAQLRQEFLDYYLQHLSVYTKTFEGIDTLMSQLAKHNIIWGIVTNKPWEYTEPLMEFFTFDSAPSAIVCPDHVVHKKPDPEALFLACQQAKCHAQNTIYIGDHPRDIQCGNRAGATTIAAAYGYIDSDINNWQADYIVNSATEIWALIQKTYGI